jgi:hypothetical protein
LCTFKFFIPVEKQWSGGWPMRRGPGIGDLTLIFRYEKNNFYILKIYIFSRFSLLHHPLGEPLRADSAFR